MAAVSVIVPTYNRAQLVLGAVNAVLCQSFRDVELFVVDDGSEDDTREVLTPFADRLTLLVHHRNRGAAAARNTGIRASRAPLIAFLDSDDHWLPDKLAAQVAFFEDDPGAVACQTEETWIRNGRRVNPRRRHRKPSGDIFLRSLELCLVSPSAVMLRRSVLGETGLFDEDLPACEDYDLWLRIGCRWPIALIPRPLVIRQGGHPDQLSARFRGLDRFRILALVKLLRRGRLTSVQRAAVQQELARKCGIYGTGCLKRGRQAEARFYLGIPDKIL